MTATDSAPVVDEARVDALAAELVAERPPRDTDPVEFLAAQFDKGLAWVHFPEGEGGLGVNPKLQARVNATLFPAGAPNPFGRNPIGYGMCGPTVVEWGSDDQKQRYLRPMFSSEEIWCQLFSEPGSGSDFASLSTRAERDGQEWVVNGQKVWTSLAHLSRWGLLVTRTDPDVPKHAGLTAFVVDMHAPGVDVRPLRQMTGEAEFNEVYFTDVRIPDAERLGEPGDGWRVSLTTLMNERVSIGGTVTPRGSGPIAHAVDLWAALPPERKDPATRDALARLWIESEVNRLTNQRANANRRAGAPGPEGSSSKLAFAESNQRVFAFCVRLMGADGMLYGSYAMARPEAAAAPDTVSKAFLRSRANSIEGGTSEVMRNILGERLLGLPGDIRVDRELPWSQVPRS